MASKYCVTMTLPNGQRKYYYGSTKKEAIKKRDADKLLVGKGVDVADSTTFKQMADAWYTLYKEGQVSTLTEEQIKRDLRLYINPKLGDRKLKDIKPMHIQAVMSSISDLSHGVNAHVLQIMRAVFLMAEENDMVAKSPVRASLKAGGKGTKETEPLTKAQCDALLAAVQGTKAYPLVKLLLTSGLRIGEAMGLMWNDIDFDRGILTVNRSVIFPNGNCAGVINTSCKTVNAHRTVCIPWDTVDMLRAEKAKSKSLYVLSTETGEHWTKSSLHSALHLIKIRTQGSKKHRVEQPLDFSVHPHQLRHTCITNWFDMGLDIKEVQRLAGHANPDMTLKIYTHYIESDRFEATAAKIHGGTTGTTSVQQFCCEG